MATYWMTSRRRIGPFTVGQLVFLTEEGLRAQPRKTFRVGVVSGGSRRTSGVVYVRRLGVMWGTPHPYSHWKPLEDALLLRDFPTNRKEDSDSQNP